MNGGAQNQLEQIEWNRIRTRSTEKQLSSEDRYRLEEVRNSCVPLLLTVIVLESVVIFHKMCYILLLIHNGLAIITFIYF